MAMSAPDRSHALDHIVVVLFENRSWAATRKTATKFADCQLIPAFRVAARTSYASTCRY